MGIDDILKARKEAARAIREAQRAFRVEFQDDGDVKVYDRESGELLGYMKGRLARMMLQIGAYGANDIASGAIDGNN